ncbi:FadR/GntR family transcriptional regulator [Sphingomonas montana]|uniref:FadR/GntR family transcriptional regulator n=1 Tax=Sphingomonas montana TaxID=1843236 RepID=UPI00096F2B07|nr:FadR/GntR family transcriptional regulator [Sphingomonas montana]
MTDIPPAEALRIRRRPRLAEAVVEDLVKSIVTETYPAGTALPPEGMLGDIYEVSRTVIREATMALTEKGLVVSQQGRGTIVRDAGAWRMLDPMILSALFQREDGLAHLDNVSEIRSLLEGAMAGKAAQRRTPEEIAELTEQMAKLGRLIPHPAAYVHEDVAFHDIVMRISGDKLSKAVIDGVQAEALRNHGYNGKLNVEHVRQTHAAHEAIYDAIVAGDPDRACQAMRDHIESSWARRRAARKPRR